MSNFLSKMMAACLLFLFTGMMQLSASNENSAVLQGIPVTGTVTENGDPMPGVNVVVKGTLTGMVTDVNGRYTITVPNANAVLVFSFIGYVTSEMTVGERRIIDVELREESSQIEEVVVIGYGTARKRDLTGSVVQVNAAQM